MFNFDMSYKGDKVIMAIKETKCVFKEDTHQYFLVDVATGEVIKELISVTTLLKKHGLSPDYSSVPNATLEAKARYGKLVHKELEEYIKDGEIGFTQELQDFINWNKEHDFDAVDSEFIVHNDMVAGTVDLLGEQRFAEEIFSVLGDFKTTATLHKDTVSWQLSIYAYLYKNLFGGEIAHLQAFHFNDGLKVVGIDFIPTEEIEKLFEAESKGEIYQGKQLKLAEDLELKLIEAEETIKAAELQKKKAEEDATIIREMIITAMRDQGVELYENERIRLKYTAPTTQSRIDSKRLQKELPDIAKQYTMVVPVKDKVTITLKSKGEI